MRPATHLNEAGSILTIEPYRFRVGGSMLAADRIEHVMCVPHQPLLAHTVIRLEQVQTEVYKLGTIHRPLVVLPHCDAFVLTIDGHRVDGVFFSFEELLHEDGSIDAAKHILLPEDLVERCPGFALRLRDEDPVRPC
eukprot:CAMPEP_0194538328 /NCGR_PEP_ID=MMETSP0253-20130528/77823_1 /TAXON_ID=2966 /ORGANISM="Noctiluca scintillans" /LENGTH=136 /DNA_ID=CAMNT_0039384429 /DNA_START=530 /DNA_END=940 /DNA_ORIENTATION=-